MAKRAAIVMAMPGRLVSGCACNINAARAMAAITPLRTNSSKPPVRFARCCESGNSYRYLRITSRTSAGHSVRIHEGEPVFILRVLAGFYRLESLSRRVRKCEHIKGLPEFRRQPSALRRAVRYHKIQQTAFFVDRLLGEQAGRRSSNGLHGSGSFTGARIRERSERSAAGSGD